MGSFTPRWFVAATFAAIPGTFSACISRPQLYWNVTLGKTIAEETKESFMTDRKQTDEQKKAQDPDLRDVAVGGDADATPTPEINKTPPNPNGNQSDAEVSE